MPRGSGLIYGMHSPEHRAAVIAGYRRFMAAGGQRRCTAMAKSGAPCRRWALRECAQCLQHAPPAIRRERRLARNGKPKTPAQAQAALRREAARVQRVLWRKDRWTTGTTVDLGEREAAFVSDVWAAGFHPERFSPAGIDAARWAWLNMQARRMTPDQFRARLALHAAMDRGVAAPRSKGRGLVKDMTWKAAEEPELDAFLERHARDLCGILERMGTREEELRLAATYRAALADEPGAWGLWVRFLREAAQRP